MRCSRLSFASLGEFGMRETLKATEVLVREGFKPMVYCVDDPIAAKQLEEAGAVAIMVSG